MPYQEPGARSYECPISRLDYKTIQLVENIERAEWLRKTMNGTGMSGGTGTITLYGPNLSEWPSYTVDAMLVFMEEAVQVDNALYKLDHPQQQ